MKWTALFVLGFVAVVMAYAEADLPGWADPSSPASVHRSSTHYIEDAYEEMRTPNMVTAVIADYRGYDTLFETAVIFTAGLACVLILREARRK